MSGSNRGEFSKTGLIIISATIALASAAVAYAIIHGLKEQSVYEQEARDGHTVYSRNSRAQIEHPCFGMAAPKRADCIAEARYQQAERENDNRREYADLVAQRTSALWTKIMGIAALVGMLLSSMGVILVWTTFRETRRAAEVSEKNLDTFIGIERGNIRFVDGSVGISTKSSTEFIALNVRNTGRSTCYIKSCFIADENGEITNEAERWVTIGVGDTESVPFFPPPKKDGRMYEFLFGVVYQSSGGRPYKSHTYANAIWHTPPGDSVFGGLRGWRIEVRNQKGHRLDT